MTRQRQSPASKTGRGHELHPPGFRADNRVSQRHKEFRLPKVVRNQGQPPMIHSRRHTMPGRHARFKRNHGHKVCGDRSHLRGSHTLSDV